MVSVGGKELLLVVDASGEWYLCQVLVWDVYVALWGGWLWFIKGFTILLFRLVLAASL